MNDLRARLDLLRRTQNPDGGWGYLPGKQSWLEPTVYASLCLHGEPAAGRAWELISGWQNEDGSWRPSQEVRTSTWATALCVTLAAVRQESGRELGTGAGWLLGLDSSAGAKGWSWTINSVSAAEPTAHAMVALKKSGLSSPDSRNLKERLEWGETRLLASKPEAAGFVLLGLQERDGLDSWVESGVGQLGEARTPALTRAWLRIALRLHGEKLPAAHLAASTDLMLASLEALGDENGNYGLLRSPGGRA